MTHRSVKAKGAYVRSSILQVCSLGKLMQITADILNAMHEGLAGGTYRASVNKKPTASAGADQSVEGPASCFSRWQRFKRQRWHNWVTYAWSQVELRTAVTLANANAAVASFGMLSKSLSKKH
ncbi:hypothetical protein OK016_28585 [Vibrio chagasii]|nr:hypothetical protein [Vibrio chagasii]